MKTYLQEAGRIALGLIIMGFGAAMTTMMIEMGIHAHWEIATIKDIASYVFSLGMAIAIMAGGSLLTVNPKIHGARIWE